MKKTKIFSAVVSAAAAIAMLSAPVYAFYDNPIDLCEFKYIRGRGSCGTKNVVIYDNGMAFAYPQYTSYYVLTPEKGIELSRELLEIPDNYEFTIDDKTSEARLPMPNKKIERDELEKCIMNGLRSGLLSEAETETTLTGKCIDDVRLAINLKDGIDIDEFIADYPQYELTTDKTDVPEEYKDYQLFTRIAEMDEMLDVSEKGFKFYIGDDRGRKNKSDKSRVQSYEYFGKTCDEIHSITNHELFFDEYNYIIDPENIAWEDIHDDGRTVIYKNGTVYPYMKNNTSISFLTTDDYRNDSDFTDLPDKYIVENPEWTYDELSLKRIISLNNEEEIDEVAPLVKGWAEKGIITEPVINRSYSTYYQGWYEIHIELEDTNEYESFKADYPDYTIYNKNDREILSFVLYNEQNSKVPEILEMIRSDSRVKSARKKLLYHDTQKTIDLDPEPIEFDAPETPSDNKTDSYIRGDISGNNQIDLYDAIEIAKYIVGIRNFTDEEMSVADINDDGKVDIYDAIAIAKKLISI